MKLTSRERVMLKIIMWLYDTLNNYISGSGSTEETDKEMYAIKSNIEVWKRYV